MHTVKLCYFDSINYLHKVKRNSDITEVVIPLMSFKFARQIEITNILISVIAFVRTDK